MVGLQATVKRDNGQSELVPLFHEQENVSGEVGYCLLGLVVSWQRSCSSACIDHEKDMLRGLET